MQYKYLNELYKKSDFTYVESDKINPFLLKNNQKEILKAVEFIDSDEKFLYVHGFMGTGKRQFINYACEYLDEDVIVLEYYCKEATVSDDILLTFSDIIDKLPIAKAISVNAKISSLNTKFINQISSIKKPFLIILHSLDDVLTENLQLISSNILDITKEENVKLIVSTRAMKPQVIEGLDEDRKIFLKAFTKEIFKKFLISHKIEASQTLLEDFYKYTRGYYYYVALSIKIIQAMNINLSEFLTKFNQAEISFDSFLGITYLNLVPIAIRNFFWFLRTLRHGINLNALAVFELHDEFAINYLKDNLMIFLANETLYVQDYFLQKIDISIPEKTEIKLHKYIVNIYEEQLKESLKTRLILLSRQALRLEIEYHKSCIEQLEKSLLGIDNQPSTPSINNSSSSNTRTPTESIQEINSNDSNLQKATKYYNNNKYTESIEVLNKMTDIEDLNLQTLVEVRLLLAKNYLAIEDYSKAAYYYELVETYYIQHNELINLNYLHYDLASLYFKMYKNERAIETVKKVIYSVDTPQSLLVDACILIANIYAEIKNIKESHLYYKKALDSISEDIKPCSLAELYFKYALANDDNQNYDVAFDYYNKCIGIREDHPYKALAYSNIASCYLENDNVDDAKFCFKRAYDIEKKCNNYDGIYYNALNLAKLTVKTYKKQALTYLTDAKKCAEFLNEPFYILEAALELGDFYYDDASNMKACLNEYLLAKSIAQPLTREIDISKIESRINDMRHRMPTQDFEEIEKKYARKFKNKF